VFASDVPVLGEAAKNYALAANGGKKVVGTFLTESTRQAHANTTMADGRKSLKE